MPYAVPEEYFEMAKSRAKATIALQSRKQSEGWRHYSIAFAAASICVAFVIFGVLKEVLHKNSYEDFVSQLETMPTEVLYEMSCDMVEYYDEHLLSDVSK